MWFKVTNDVPFKEQLRWIPLSLVEEVHAHLCEMLDSGTIHPSQSAWCNAVVLLWMKDGSLYFCIDFHPLNAHMKKGPLPAAKNPRGHLKVWSAQAISHVWTWSPETGRSGWMSCQSSTLHLLLATWAPLSVTACPLGYGNVPATFQRLMQNCLRKLNLTYCLIYLNDITLFLQMAEEHLHCLYIVFDWF